MLNGTLVRIFLVCIGLTVCSAQAQQTPIVSPEVQSDHRVIFRLRSPNAQKVELQLEGTTQHVPMQKDDSGLWSVTTDSLEPDYYGYSFVADGVSLIDPRNPLMKPNLLGTETIKTGASPFVSVKIPQNGQNDASVVFKIRIEHK